MCRDISDDRCTGSHRRPFTYPDLRNDGSTYSNQCPRANSDTAGEATARRNVGKIVDHAVMIDRRSRVDDYVRTEYTVRLDDSTCAHECAGA